MKIIINYDLLDKMREAKTGISLIRSFKRTMFYTGIQSPFVLIENIAVRESIEKFFLDIIICLSAHTLFTGINAMFMAKIYQNLAIQTMNNLLFELNNNCIKTDQDNIINAYKYKTEYGINLDGFCLPKLEQKKYIMIPVEDDWGKREISLVQEHIVGTNKYVLSVGSPEEKVYRLTPKRIKQI